MQRQTLKPFPQEPNTDTVPAMLTPGEFVIRKDAVDAIGVDKLNLMNNIDRLGQLSSLMEYRPSGYQQGGVVKNRKKSMKGFLGPIINKKTGKIQTELSISFDDILDGIEIPLLVPTLTKEEINWFINNDASNNAKDVPNSIKQKAINHAIKRSEQGLNVFYEDKENEKTNLQEGGEVMLKTNKENLPNPGLKALFDSGAQGKEALANMGYEQGGKVMGYGDGGTVMDYYGGGMVKGYEGGGKVVSETLDVFGDKSSAADELNAVMALRAMRMQQGGMVPGMMPPQMPAQSLPPAGMMMQEGGMVDQPMPQGEPMGMDMQPMPTGERAFPASSPMEQLDLQPNEMMAYEQYGPETFRYMATKFKPRAEFTPYDAMVDAGIVDPYETSEDDFVVMTRDMANSLRGMNGV